MKKFDVIGMGEILWDILPDGAELGGAPSNFAIHAKNMGAESMVISAIGTDSLGNKILALLEQNGIATLLNSTTYPTSTVTVALKDGIPSYTIHENVAWDYIQLDERHAKSLRQADAICFGSLAQRSKTTFKSIQEALEIVPEHALKVFDINLRQEFYTKKIIHHSLMLSNILKLNIEELAIVRQMFNLTDNEEDAIQQLINRYSLKLVALTKGAKGSMLVTPDEISTYKVPTVNIVDTIGAGDSFTASMVMGLLNKKQLKQIHKEATLYAAKVCMYKGATPKIDKSL